MTDFIHLPAAQLKPATLALPGSKSISNRVLLLAALADNTCTLVSLLRSDDTLHMRRALEQLGIVSHETDCGDVVVKGCGGTFPHAQADLFLGNAGTAFRPLTAALAILGGDYALHGVARMHERPIGDLVDALRQTGAHIEYKGTAGYPPLSIGQRQDSGRRTLSVNGAVSSQFLTALLMALPLTGQAYNITVAGDLISKPYIDITLKLMAQFGVEVTHDNHAVFHLPAHSRYHAPDTVYVEGDASSASYFLAAGLIGGQPIRVTGMGKNSIQGDVAFANELAKIGATVLWGEDFIEVSRPANQAILPFDLDANHIPDAAMTLAIVALASSQTCRLRNIASWRVKETDRIGAMAHELRKLGANVVETEDSIAITPPPKLNQHVRIDTYDDHRMAMCFALVSFMDTAVIINEPECVNKTFPGYFDELARLQR